VFIRLSGTPALGIAFWRSVLGALVLFPIALCYGERFPRGWALVSALLSGVALGTHFGFWISSLDHTSVAASVVLVSTQPVFVAVLGSVLLGETTSRLSLAGILVAIAGTAVIAGLGESSGEASFLGNSLALLGAISVAAYVLIGRSMRSGGVGVLPYAVVVYAAAALAVAPVALFSGVPLSGYGVESWLWIAVIVVGPQLMGHTVLNWALGYVPASIVSGSILAEPVGASLLAWAVLSEKPGTATVLGGAVVLAGLSMLVRGRYHGQP
jgi:drug/metabolite transporter (DMT)-like permease